MGVCAYPPGVCMCGRVYMRVGALPCACAHVCGCRAAVAAELQAGLALVSSRAGSRPLQRVCILG